MRNVWFYLLVSAIWVLIFFLGVTIYNGFQQEAVEVKAIYYNWEALVDEDFICVDEVELDKVISYEDIGLFMSEVSDGMFQDIEIVKEDFVKVSMNMHMQGKYVDKLKTTFPDMDWMFDMVQGLPLEIVCDPTFDNGVILNIHSAKVGMIDLPLSMFEVLEEEISDVLEDIVPLEVYTYHWQMDGLYIHGLVPLRIERNS